jgi:hypothetical protein
MCTIADNTAVLFIGYYSLNERPTSMLNELSFDYTWVLRVAFSKYRIYNYYRDAYRISSGTGWFVHGSLLDAQLCSTCRK